MTHGNKSRYIPPVTVVCIVSTSIFISHISVMVASGDHWDYSDRLRLILDSTLLTLLLLPLLYFLVFRPLLKQIEAREKAGLQLLANERKFRDLVESMNEGLVVQNNEGIITFVNKCFADMINLSREELIGIELNELLDMDNSLILHQNQNNFSQPSSSRSEITWKANNKRDIYSTISSSLIFDESDSVIGKFFVVTDITQRKEMELELIKANEHAKHSDNLKSEFLNLISHEIRTPVNIVFGFTDLIEEEYSRYAELGKYIANIKIGLKRLVRTMDLILDSAREISGLNQLDFKPVDIVNDAIRPVLLELSQPAKEKEIMISTSLDLFPKVIADQYSLNQIMIHLIENAIKFTAVGGNININVLKSSDGMVMVSISDNGIGISSEYIPNLFTLFSQEDESSNRKFDGSGLGLFLAKKYCDANNIQIFVTSEKGKGSTFTLVFANVAAC